MIENSQNNDRHFLYLYFNRDQPEKIRQVVPAHVHYWKAANLKGYRGGPFTDRTGGVIFFVAPDPDVAMEIILQDPFILEDLINQKWMKEWLPE